MPALIPLVFLLSSSYLLQQYFNMGWRASLLLAGILIGVVVTIITETLSAFHLLTSFPVLLIWSVLATISFILALAVLKRGSLAFIYPKFARDEKIILSCIAFILAISGITALSSAPNNWDSMTYHLARVEHWIQNKTIAYYPTNIIRQLYYCPWAEYAITQLRLLTAPQSAVHLVQWFSMLGAVMGVSLIAKQWGASHRGQLLASLLAITVPMGILQSVSTQTDYVITFWLICFVFFLMKLQHDFKILYVVAIALSLGLAFLTKGYGYIMAIPFMAWLTWSILKAGRIKRLWVVVFIIIIAISLNAGYYYRNAQAFGSMRGVKNSLLNASFDAKVLGGNLLRNLGVHLATPVPQFNDALEKTLSHTAAFLHIDINDSRAIYLKNKFSIAPITYDEDISGNLLHLILFGLIIFMYCRNRRRYAGLGSYLLVLACAVILFCWTVRYQPWISRFHLPFFILFCPVAGVVMDRISRPMRWVVAVLFIAAMPYLFLNTNHPWFGSSSIWQQSMTAQTFRGKKFESSYRQAAVQLGEKNCGQVGIVLGGGDWEYPLWVLLKEQYPAKDLRIEHVQVTNASSQLLYPLGPFNPCAVLTLKGDTLAASFR